MMARASLRSYYLSRQGTFAAEVREDSNRSAAFKGAAGRSRSGDKIRSCGRAGEKSQRAGVTSGEPATGFRPAVLRTRHAWPDAIDPVVRAQSGCGSQDSADSQAETDPKRPVCPLVRAGCGGRVGL